MPQTTTYQLTRGRVQRRCKICRNAYHADYQREHFWRERTLNALSQAMELVKQVAKRPSAYDPTVVKLAASFGAEIKRRWRRNIKVQETTRS